MVARPPEWVAILTLVTAVEMVLLWLMRRLFAAPLPVVNVRLKARLTGFLLLTGAVMTTYALAFLAAAGSHPTGDSRG